MEEIEKLPCLLTLGFPEDRQIHPILRSVSGEVRDFGPKLDAVVSEIRRIFYSLPHGHGMAAIQIGIPLRIAIINLSRQPEAELLIINAQILQTSGRLVKRMEGCLSLPGYKGIIRRRSNVKILFIDRWQVSHEYSASGYEAAVIQHEIDHMDGLFYWDNERSKPQLLST